MSDRHRPTTTITSSITSNSNKSRQPTETAGRAWAHDVQRRVGVETGRQGREPVRRHRRSRAGGDRMCGGEQSAMAASNDGGAGNHRDDGRDCCNCSSCYYYDCHCYDYYDYCAR